MYRIREIDGAEEDDVLAALHQLTFVAGERLPSFEEGHWWLAFYEGRPVGFAGVVPAKMYAHTGYFTRVGVLPSCAGGLQIRFMRAIERRARKNGWTRLVSDTTNNIRSANNFIRAGWKLFQPAAPWAFAHSLYWERYL